MTSRDTTSTPLLYKTCEGVHLVTTVCGRGRLINLNGNTFNLNSSGFLITEQLLLSGKKKAVQAVQREYGINENMAVADVDALSEALVAGKLLTNESCQFETKSKVFTNHTMILRTALGLLRRTQPIHPIAAHTLIFAANLTLWRSPWHEAISSWHRALGAAALIPTMQDVDLKNASLLSKLDSNIRVANAFSPFPSNCKHRALAAFALCKKSGLAPTLNLGYSVGPYLLHAWTSCSGRIIGDYPESSTFFTPFVQYT